MAPGGKRKGAGRPLGARNKTTVDIKALAQSFGAKAIARLAHLAIKAENETAQIAACKELLDRGYGRAVQSVQQLDGAGNPANTPMRVIVELVGAPAAAPIEAPRGGPRLLGASTVVQLKG